MDKTQIGSMIFVASAIVNASTAGADEIPAGNSALDEKIEYAQGLLETVCAAEPGFDINSPEWQWEKYGDEIISEIIAQLENNIKQHCKPYDLTTLTALIVKEPNDYER